MYLAQNPVNKSARLTLLSLLKSMYGIYMYLRILKEVENLWL